jgi:plastocyanin
MRVRTVVMRCAAAVIVAGGVGAAVVHAAGGGAAPKTVAVTVGPMGNLVFSPNVAHAKVGDAVKWTWGSSGHTTTDESGLALWDTGVKSVNSTFSFTFAHAGTYNYECTVHGFLGMTGKVKTAVKITASGTTATVTWATAAPASGFVEDVQSEAPGATKFTTVVNGSTAMSKAFSLMPGTWAFRARYRNTTTGKKTAWSPVVKVAIS